MPLANSLRDAGPEQQAAIVRHIVERVVVEDGEFSAIHVSLEARPFFADFAAGMAVAPPDGLEPPTQALGRPRSIH
jgi:hypothetical protein